MADPKPTADIAAVPEVPEQPTAIVLNKHYSWFTTATKSTPSRFVERNSGETITDPDEIAYFIGINADFTAA